MWLLKSIYARRFTLMFYFLGSDGNTYRDHKDIIFFTFIVLVIVIFLLGFSLTCSVGFNDDNSKSRIFSFSCILIWVDLGSKTFSTYIVVRDIPFYSFCLLTFKCMIQSEKIIGFFSQKFKWHVLIATWYQL